MKNKPSNKKITFIIFAVIFIFMLILNLLTPLIADDFSYSFGLHGRINNLYDVLEKQINHYFSWGGRTVAHTIGQIFLLFPKVFFSIANTFAYIILIYLIYRIVKDKKEDKPILIVIINLLLWFIVPVFGQNCLWLIGSCNYLWTMDIILFFILKYIENKPVKKKTLSTILMFILGILAGWTNENTAFGAIVIVSSIIFFMKKNKEKLEIWHISGLIGIVIGYILLIGAPGNYIRSTHFTDTSPIIKRWIYRVINYSINLVDILKPLILLTIVLISINIYYKNKPNKNVIIFQIASILSVYSMVLSPTFPDRAYFGVIVYAIISVMYLFYNIDELNKIFKYIIIDIVLMVSVIYCSEYLTALLDIKELRNTWNYRIKYIETEKNNNNLDIKVKKYTTSNKYNPNYGLEDITIDETNWPNCDIARYFEIKSISSK